MPLNLRTEPLRPFNVLAFDPGGTTGWAQAVLIRTDNVELEDIHLWTGEFGPEPHHRELYDFLNKERRHADLEIVYEPFTYRQHIEEDAEGRVRASRHKVELISAEYIGVIKLACSELGLTYYDRFTPGEAKRYVTNEKLSLLGWLQTPPHPMRHRNDALRQLVKYLIVRKGVRHPLTTTWKER